MPDLVSFVIPVANEPRNDTLPIAIATVRKHLPWTRLVLVGPPLLVSQYLEPERGELVIPFEDQRPHQPVENTTRMLLRAAAEPRVTDTFLWSADDIFFREPVTLEELEREADTAIGRLETEPSRGTYGSVAHSTKRALEKAGRPTWNYERHSPMVVNSLMALELLKPGFSPRSLYQNTRLDRPVAVKPDVKAFTVAHLAEVEGPLFSTGSRFPVAEIQSFLDRRLPESSSEG